MPSASLCSRRPTLFPNRQDLPAAGSELARGGLGSVHGLSGTRQTLGLRETQTPGAAPAEEPEPEQDPQTKPQNRGTRSSGGAASVCPAPRPRCRRPSVQRPGHAAATPVLPTGRKQPGHGKCLCAAKGKKRGGKAFFCPLVFRIKVLRKVGCHPPIPEWRLSKPRIQAGCFLSGLHF